MELLQNLESELKIQQINIQYDNNGNKPILAAKAASEKEEKFFYKTHIRRFFKTLRTVFSIQ